MPERARARRAAAVLLAVIAVDRCAAADPALPPVIVTGSQLPRSESTASQSVVVLSEREVRDRAAATMPELLRNSAALHVDQPGIGGFASLYLRGADPSHTLILIDGVKVSDPTNARGGGIDLSSIDPRTIARVEILHGASSAIYGADAMAGVVNLITRRPQQSGARVGGGIGGVGYRSAFASGDMRSNSIGVRAEAAATNDGGGGESGFVRLRSGAIRVDAGEPNERRFSASVRMQHSTAAAFPEDSGGPVLAVRRQLDRRETEGIVAALDGETPTAWGALRLYSNLFSQDTDLDTPGVAPGARDPFGLPRTVSASRYRRWSVGATTVVGTGEEPPLLIGVQYEKEQGEVTSTLFFGPFAAPANFSKQRDTRSAFAEGRVRLGGLLTAQLGGRVDDVEGHGTHATVNAGAVYRVPRFGQRLALSYGTGFKPPSFFALGHPIVGNPQLKPEESRTVEASVASDAVAARLAYRLAIFRSKYENLVDFDPGPPPSLVNRSGVGIKGYDASASLRAANTVTLKAGVTTLVFDLPDGAPPLRSRPRHRATASAAYAPTAQVSAGLYASWVDRAFDSSIPTGGMYLSPYAVVDASIAYAIRGARVVIAVDNVLDKDYRQFIGFPARGRRARLELALEL
jgi:outer membrane cobalamin receptor